ncbi:pathogenesis-related protein PRB1-3-like [Arachis stenosperma]|uniref:pathogenesis-related protein PRB1-3-like n=1 Tax=Arachis stenosperma TaxID=217475 RepID=UPI0025ABFF14|nr:pathogenesis-related protein PRB1-3-like [Arachis stenosperma]
MALSPPVPPNGRVLVCCWGDLRPPLCEATEAAPSAPAARARSPGPGATSIQAKRSPQTAPMFVRRLPNRSGEQKMQRWIGEDVLVLVAQIGVAARNSSGSDYLRIHNDARAKVGVEPLKWDRKLARHAMGYVYKYISRCNIIRFTKSKYGQNIVRFKYSSELDRTGKDAVTFFVNQERYYDYKTNSCIDDKNQCLYYTQVVWRTTTSVGCSGNKCLNNQGTLFTCYYSPKGNIPNERPY